MMAVQRQAEQGHLPEEARWLTRTRLVYLHRPGRDLPRPIRIGEFLRSAQAKRTLRAAAPRLRSTFRAISGEWRCLEEL